MHAKNVTVYKALAGQGATLASYNEACEAATHDQPEAEAARSLERQEWRGLYTQFAAAHVLGTVPYRWEKEGTTHARLVAVTFEELEMVVLDGPLFHDGTISGGKKAMAVKAQLGMDPTKPLMAALGERGQVVLVRETADEWELVFPHALLPRLCFSERGVAVFAKHPRMPVTQRWRQEVAVVVGRDGARGEEGVRSWSPWREDKKVLEGVPDLDMAWLPQNTNTDPKVPVGEDCDTNQ